MQTQQDEQRSTHIDLTNVVDATITLTGDFDHGCFAGEQLRDLLASPEWAGIERVTFDLMGCTFVGHEVQTTICSAVKRCAVHVKVRAGKQPHRWANRAAIETLPRTTQEVVG